MSGTNLSSHVSHVSNPELFRARVIVVGGGPAGSLAALGLAQSGVETVLITQTPPPPGTAAQARTAALFLPSIALLKNCGIWDACAPSCAPLTGIRLIDAMGSTLRAPEVLFTAAEIETTAFGYNVPNRALAASLSAALSAAATSAHASTGISNANNRPSPTLTWLEGRTVRAVTPRDQSIDVTLDDGTTVTGALVVGADGQRSVCRLGAGIGQREASYDQVAITTTFAHQRPHGGISTEFHRLAGPLTTVPMPENMSSLVWVERPAVAQRLLAMDDATFLATLGTQLQGLLGTLSAPSPRGRFPLAFAQADALAAKRVILVGEAAHLMPPIGAQGLNLGLRDVGCLIDCVVAAQQMGRDLGGHETLANYCAARSTDVSLRMAAVDALNRSLLSEFGFVRLARGVGLHVVAALAPLRRRLILEGLKPSGTLPSLMRHAALAE